MSYWAERRTPSLPEETLRAIPDDIPRWKIAYWQFQHALTREHVVPFLEMSGALPGEGRILEVGAGEGGCLAALTMRTGLPGDGVELSAPRAALGARLNAAMGHTGIAFHTADIARSDQLAALSPPYALVLLRDVIEHVEDRRSGLRNLFALTAPGGHAFFTFPPYHSPFGGHQQILTRAWMRMPWIQNLPVFDALVRANEPNAGKIEEMRSIRRCSLTIGAFEREARAVGYRILARRVYLLRPAFRYRYGTPIVGAGPIGAVPGLRELVTSASWYLLRRDA
jgi:SAM-dependent methyltransferase